MNAPRRIAIFTGTRAEYGLLETVLDAIEAHPNLERFLIVGGSHLLPEVRTIDGIIERRPVAAEIPMQQAGQNGFAEDVRAVARGIDGCIRAYEEIMPDVVLILGDRIEAFAAASAASIGGYTLAHIHGGDRAEGVADEAMRHAITKLAHIHFPATSESASRIQQMGEHPETVFMVGSPAADGIADIAPMSDEDYERLGSPRTIFLMHGTGSLENRDYTVAKEVITACKASGPVLALAPNTDPGSAGISRAIHEHCEEITIRTHLSRNHFVSVLQRVDALVGNSSAGLIEAAIIGCPSINIGPRQNGRERAENVVDVMHPTVNRMNEAIRIASEMPRNTRHPFGDGHSGQRIAEVLGKTPITRSPRKRNSY